MKFNNQFKVYGLPFEKDQHVPSYAGFIPIRNLSYNEDGTAKNTADIFFWYFPALEPTVPDPPVLIWLQGGPGSSSMIGLFYEMGPLKVTRDLKLLKNNETWNKHYDMIFIDNPVGTGWSRAGSKQQVQTKYANHTLNFPNPKEELNNHTMNDCESPHDEKPQFNNGFVSNQAAVAHDMIIFLDRFYVEFPELLKRDLYLTGESYAGKYIPATAYHINKVNRNRNQDSKHPQIPLKGIAVGNGLSDPITQIKAHAELGLGYNLISKVDADLMNQYADLVIQKICQKEWVHALGARFDLFEIFYRSSGGINYYDIRMGNTSYHRQEMFSFLKLESTVKSLNLPEGTKFGTDVNVSLKLEEDVMKSSAWYFPQLLESGIQVLLYYGQFDYRDGYYGSRTWINSLNWSGQSNFLKAKREIWAVDNKIAGYSTQYNNLKLVEVSGCGHLCPIDQGTNTRFMIEKFLVGET